MKVRTHTQLLTRDQALLLGIPKRLVGTTSVLIDGTSYTAATLTPILQKRIAAMDALTAAEAAYHKAVQTTEATLADTAPTISKLVEALYLGFGEDPAALQDFGLPERKRGVMTSEQLVAASEKAKATRAARHTMGPKQKAKIQGNVTGVTIEPVVAGTPEGEPVT